MKGRAYESADAAAVSRLIRSTMRLSNSGDYEMEKLEPLIDYFSPERVEELSHDRFCFVAEEAGEIIGTGALEGNELVTFFVEPGRQRRGIGSALLRAVEEMASAQGLSELVVGASIAGAPFYESRGYVPTGETPQGTAGRHIAMRKVLD